MEGAMEMLNDGIAQIGLAPDDRITGLFKTYVRLIEECPHNLTSIKGAENMVKEHFLDSLAVLRFFKPEPGKTYGDIGSGAGFPLMPLKIVYPEMDCVFVDSKRKSADFISSLRDGLGFSEKNCRVINSHTTELRKQGPKGSMDAIFVRALGSVDYCIQQCSFLLKKGGSLWLYKGPKYQEDLDSIQPAVKNRISKIEINDAKVPFLEKTRFIIRICFKS